MTTHLPDDFSCWPLDPYEILGVPRDADRRTLRQAYARLILVYKPEQFPEQFQRIRRAYEMLLRWDEAGTSSVPPSMPANPAPLAFGGIPVLDEQGARTGHVSDESSRPPMPRSPEPELDHLWQRAIDGAVDDAYAKLVAWQERNPWHPDVYLRLYWLLIVVPVLDSQRTAGDWLVAGLGRTEFSGRLLAVYCNELEEHPVEVLTERSAGLLNAWLSIPALNQLVAARWKAAAHLGRWDILAVDIERLRERSTHHAGESWMRLLLSAVDRLVWADDPVADELLKAVLDEIGRFDDLQLRLPEELRRCDLARTIAAEWRGLRLRTWPGELAQVLIPILPQLWNGLPLEMRPILLALSERLLDRRQHALKELDRLARSSPTLVNYLAQCFSELPQPMLEERDAEPAPELLARRILDGLEDCPPHAYQSLRPELLTFCVRESISPDQIATVLSTHPDCTAAGIAEPLQTDAGLQVLWAAQQALWG